jgi:hypothetical protein
LQGDILSTVLARFLTIETAQISLGGFLSLAGCRTDTTMLNQIIELCTSSNGLFWLVLGSDLSIAVAYFAIPITMAIVLRDRKDDIPYPWLWTLFVTFIVACGLTHTAHVWSAATGFDYLEVHAGIGLFCAITSVGTAIAFAFILPQIKLLPSPRQQRAQLEKQVAQRTAEKDQLIREINHRVGNQLQIIRSMVSVENRRTKTKNTLDVLGRLMAELDKMALEHVKRSQADYLQYSIAAADGTITHSIANEGQVITAS